MGISSIGCSSIMQQMKQQMETSFKSSDADGDGKLSKASLSPSIRRCETRLETTRKTLEAKYSYFDSSSS